MTPSPSFSVIVCTYQRCDMVCKAVRSLCGLSYDGPIEIIVVVDGSTDGTAVALAALECTFPIRVIEQQNRGLSAARNRGAAEATGELLLFLDDDMICEPDILRQHARMYAEGADAVTGNIPIHPESPPGVLTDAVASSALWEGSVPSTPFEIYAGQLSIKKSAFDALGGFDEEFCADGGYGNEDLEFGARLLEQFHVRHNPAAVCRQLNLVSAREFMERASHLAAADLRLAAKHPHLGRQLFSHRAAKSRAQRLIHRLVSASPAVAALSANAMVRLCELALPTRFRSNRLLGYAFVEARSIAYWSTIRKLAGPAVVREFLRL